MKRLGAFGILMMAMAALPASQTSNYSLPSYVTVQSNNIVLVWVPNPLRSGAIPACTAPSGGGYFPLAFSIATDAGKAMFSEILAAQQSNRALWAIGSGDCGVAGNVESLATLIGTSATGQ